MRALPPFLGQPGPTTYHRLDPLTKFVVAVVTSLGAVIVGGIVGPLILVLLGVVLPALAARVLRRLVGLALVLALPIALSAVLINVFFFPGAQDVLLRVGPLAASREGLTLGVTVLARLMALAGAITLFYLTTAPADLVLALERRGMPPRLAWVLAASVQTIPAIVERAGAITAAQRARGLDTDASARARVRGLLPIAGPVILASLAEVEERTLALEARAFTRPGRRTLLWVPPDSRRQGVLRLALVLLLPMLLVLRLTGWLP